MVHTKKETITGADYADNLALLEKTFAHVKLLLHSLNKQWDISLYVSSDKTEFMCFKLR